MDWNKILLSILSVLITISLGLSTYIFSSMEKRLTLVEITLDNRIERIAILEQQARENNTAHARLETKLDILISVATTVVRK